MTVWVTEDRRKFTKRAVKTGLAHDGFVEILDGLSPAIWLRPKARCSSPTNSVMPDNRVRLEKV